MSAGYSGTPLERKLGLDRADRLLLIDAPSALAGLVVVPAGLRVGDLRMRWADLIILFSGSQAGLEERLPAALERLTADGALWVAWPKRSSGVPTDLTEDSVRDLVLPTGLVDVKVAAIDATWSGLKFVVRVERRESWT